MATPRAPKQWSLTKQESITSFEAWRQNLQYVLSLDQNFAEFLLDEATWLKKSTTNPLRGLANDGEPIARENRRTAQQKVTHLDLMLGQIANYCPVISRNSIVKNSTSMSSIWQAIRLHYGFQSTGSHFLDFNNIVLQPDERPEDLYQRLVSFIEDSLLIQNGNISHNGIFPAEDEELTPTLENFIVLTWIRLIHPDLPQLVKQRYGTELRSKTLASLKPEISLALDSLLEEVSSAAESRVFRSATRDILLNKSTFTPKSRSKPTINRQCPLCQQAGRTTSQHFLSKCPYLPESDKRFLSKARQTLCVEEESSVNESPTNTEPDQVKVLACRVSTNKSPHFKAFYQQFALQLTLDTGAEMNMIKASVAHYIDAPIKKSSQRALQADGITPLKVLGEVHITLSRSDQELTLDALVIADLDVDVLAGTPFMTQNDISVRPAKCQVIIKGTDVIQYNSKPSLSNIHSVRRTQPYVIRAPSSGTTLWPGDFLDLPLPQDLQYESMVAIEARRDTAGARNVKPALTWPQPTLTESVGGRIRIVNTTIVPQVLKRHEHFCQVRCVQPMAPTPVDTSSSPPSPTTNDSNTLYSDLVQLDPDKMLPSSTVQDFVKLLREYDNVFNPTISGYNGAAGPFQATVNMGAVEPPQRKGRVPQYAKDKLQELQSIFDKLESVGVFQKPENINVTVEYLNPSFLIKKSSGGFRLVTAFADVARYSKPQPSLLPDVDSILRTIACWEHIIVTDLTQAFYQIPLAKNSMKYCGVCTPFKGIRVYTRTAMGMPGSETALEELMCRVLGDLLHSGVVTKLADDLYIGGHTYEELRHNFQQTLQALSRCNLKLSAAKTVICPRSTTILGWVWSKGSIHASPHRISTLATSPQPETVRSMRSFIGAFKVLGRVLPNCSQFVRPLDNAIAGLQSKDKVPWNDELYNHFSVAQKSLTNNRNILLPRPADYLWIVTDASTSKHGIGATLYITRNTKTSLAGFFSAKLKQHQITWLPCEVEALCISAAIKHFSPFIIQSKHNACVLTDSKPCVQATLKLCRGEFSNSPRVTSFLSIVSRYQVNVHHLAGSANVPSDFASRNAPECQEPHCQICNFISRTEEPVVRSTSVQDIVEGRSPIPFASRSAWKETQSTCPDLRRTHAHLTQGTRPSKKVTNIPDVKRYLRNVTISRDGLLVVKSNEPFCPTSELIVVPRAVLCGLLTALHIKLNHPSKHQLKQVVKRRFFALDLDEGINGITDSCHTCTSLKKLPPSASEHTTEDPPDTMCISFAADVLRRCRQYIFLLRETTSSYTTCSIIADERSTTLRDALARTCMELRPITGPPAVVRVDPAPGFISLRDDPILRQLGISLEIGRTKNVNKNPVAEKAIAELENELLRHQPEGGPVTALGLSIATANLNARIRNRGLSSREMWTQRCQFSNTQLPISDRELIQSQHKLRITNHPHSQNSKDRLNHLAPSNVSSSPQVGDLVYCKSEYDKTRCRDRYLVTEIAKGWCYIRKFSNNQLRSKLYKVKPNECFVVPSFYPFNLQSRTNESDSESENNYQISSSTDREDPIIPQQAIPDVLVDPVIEKEPDLPATGQKYDMNFTSSAVDQSPQPQQVSSTLRPRRYRKKPSHLKDFVCEFRM